MQEQTEQRFVEFRAVEDRRLIGTAINYGEIANIGGFGRERFSPGAFGNVEAADAILNLQHQRQRPLARSGHGLTLTDSPQSLTVEAIMPATRDGDDVLALVEAGVLRGFSIEFLSKRDRFDGDLRTVQSAVLRGLAVVDRPAYLGSEVARRWQQRPQPRPRRRRRQRWAF